MNESGPNEHPPKAVKLRESCDSCLVAKVKCSKTRPVCSRCLANGATCGYSPSSRAGRKNRNATGNKLATAPSRRESASDHAETVPPTPTLFPHLNRPPPDDRDSAMLQPAASQGIFHEPSSSSSPKNSAQRSSSTGEISPTSQREGSDAADFLLTPPFSDDFVDPSLQFPLQPFFQEFSSTTQSLGGHAGPTADWMMNDNYISVLPSFEIPVNLMDIEPDFQQSSSIKLPPQQENVKLPGQPDFNSKYTCDCFATCLQALQTLHNHSRLPASEQPGGLPFDVVLTINQEAMRGCAAMLDCAKCVSKSGSSVSTMLLATIFGKIISLYGSACFFRFGGSTRSEAVVKLAFGTYTLTGEDKRMLEMEIILIELRKMETILVTYQEKFRNSQAENDESNVYNALTSYLDKNLQYILDFLQMRKGGQNKT